MVPLAFGITSLWLPRSPGWFSSSHGPPTPSGVDPQDDDRARAQQLASWISTVQKFRLLSGSNGTVVTGLTEARVLSGRGFTPSADSVSAVSCRVSLSLALLGFLFHLWGGWGGAAAPATHHKLKSGLSEVRS